MICLEGTAQLSDTLIYFVLFFVRSSTRRYRWCSKLVTCSNNYIRILYRKERRSKTRLLCLLTAISLLIAIAIGVTVGLVIGISNDNSSTKLYEKIQIKNAIDTLLVRTVYCSSVMWFLFKLLQNIANQYDPPRWVGLKNTSISLISIIVDQFWVATMILLVRHLEPNILTHCI